MSQAVTLTTHSEQLPALQAKCPIQVWQLKQSHTKERTTDAENIDESQNNYAESKKPDT